MISEDDEWDEEYERKFAVRWLTNLISWLHAQELDGTLLDRATGLLAISSGSSASGDYIRSFKFSLPDNSTFTVDIRDGSINSSAQDVLVGIQTWGSASILAQLIASSPEKYFPPSSQPQRLRVLELGAGTGLVSLAAAHTLKTREPPPDIVASDHDTVVIDNLRSNITRNAPIHNDVHLSASLLDWQSFLAPVKSGDEIKRSPSNGPLFDEPFDVILGADIVYEAHQAFWIKATVAALLRRPEEAALPTPPETGTVVSNARFHLVIPLRATHEGETASVLATFPPLKTPAARKTSLSSSPRTAGASSDNELDFPSLPPTLTLAMIHSEEIEPKDRRRPMKYFRCEIGWAYL